MFLFSCVRRREVAFSGIKVTEPGVKSTTCRLKVSVGLTGAKRRKAGLNSRKDCLPADLLKCLTPNCVLDTDAYPVFLNNRRYKEFILPGPRATVMLIFTSFALARRRTEKSNEESPGFAKERQGRRPHVSRRSAKGADLTKSPFVFTSAPCFRSHRSSPAREGSGSGKKGSVSSRTGSGWQDRSAARTLKRWSRFT